MDLTDTAPALLLALLADYGQPVVYVPGRTVNRMSGAYQGEAKTDARDAYVIADTARLRKDFAPIEVPTKLAADLALLTTHRCDLIADRVRLLNRLHDVLTGISPALETAFDYADHKGALALLTGYRTPAALRRCGQTRLTRWLAARRVRHPETVAATALTAAHAQHVGLIPVAKDSGRAPATCIAPSATAAAFAACSTSPPRPASFGKAPTAPTTSRNEPRDTSTSPPPEPGTKPCPLHQLCPASQLTTLGAQPTKQVIHASTP